LYCGFEAVPRLFIILAHVLSRRCAIEVVPLEIGGVGIDDSAAGVKAVYGDEVVVGIDDVIGSACAQLGAGCAVA